MNIQIVLIIGVILISGFVILRPRIPSDKRDSVPADPLAEAEVYIAYGREKQALEILKKALQKNPKRSDIESKLRELKRKM